MPARRGSRPHLIVAPIVLHHHVLLTCSKFAFVLGGVCVWAGGRWVLPRREVWADANSEHTSGSATNSKQHLKMMVNGKNALLIRLLLWVVVEIWGWLWRRSLVGSRL